MGGETTILLLIGIPSYRRSPVVPNRRMLPFLNDSVIGRKMPLLRTLDRKPGLADITRDTSRIKAFRLKDAILYSYIKDIRFVIFLSLVIGFTIWTSLVPEPLTLKPLVLAAPNLQYLTNMVIETYIDKVCSSHPGEEIPLPCSCGSPLNNETKVFFPKVTPPFDPLGIEEKVHPRRMKAIVTYFATMLLVLALSESASHHSIYLNI